MTHSPFQEQTDVLALDENALRRVQEDAPAWLAEARRSGYDAFRGHGMPTEKEESWRYVTLPFDVADLAIPGEPGAAMESSPYLDAVINRSGTAIIRDGHVVEASAPQGVTVISYQDAWRGGDETAREAWLETSNLSDVFGAAQAAFGVDGLVVDVPRGVVAEAPIVVDVQATAPGSISFPKVSIRLGVNAEASVVVVYRSAEEFLVASPHVDAVVGDGARLALTTVQAWGAQTSGIGYQRVRLGRDASLKLGEVGLGGSLGRLDLVVDLDGDGSSSQMAGIYFGDGRQVLDYRIVINHRGRNTASNVFLKGAVEDESESVFTGLLKIWRDATNTSTFEENRNLVLSEGAKAHSVPNLEILNDDVVCGHGSTVGPLEEEHLYYLQSRGLSRDRAERLLLHGFFEEMIARLPSPQLAAPVRKAVNAKFVRAQEEGRL